MHPSAPNTPPNFHPTYRPDIDGMRALAILAVVIYHAFPGKLSGGFIGTKYFFCNGFGPGDYASWFF